MKAGRSEAVHSLTRWRGLLGWVAGLLATVLLVVLGYAPVLRGLGAVLVVEDPLQPAGAIVVLGGSIPFRAIEAAELYLAEWAPRVVVTRGPRWERDDALAALGITYSEKWKINREILLRLGVPPAAVIVPEGGGAGTLEELWLVTGELRPQSDPVILVTSKSHSRRVALTWRQVAGSEWRGIVRPAQKDPFDPDRWWQQRRFALEVVREYLGLFNYWVGFPVPAPLPSAR